MEKKEGRNSRYTRYPHILENFIIATGLYPRYSDANENAICPGKAGAWR